MERITYRITLDARKNGVQKVLQGFQTGDENARRIEISLVSGSESYTLLDDDITAVMYVTVPGATSPSVNECEIDGSKMIYDILPTDIAIEGTVQMQLKLIDGSGSVLVSPRFDLEVWESNVSDSAAEATQTFTALEKALAEAKEARNKTISHIYIDEDNIFTVEYVDGTVYTSTVIADAVAQIADIQGYVDTAVQAATDADASMKAADLSAQAAAISETNAATSEANAKASELAAAQSEANAKASENTASSAASIASQAAIDAAASEVNALRSENAAAQSEANALNYKNDAYASAQAAAQSAASVAQSEINAAQSEADALNYSTLSQSYAVGGTNTRPNENNDNAMFYMQQCQQIAGGLQGGFIPMGTVTFATLATLTPNSGYMYNVSDEFVTDARFKDGAGKKYAAGTNVYWTADSKWDCLSGAVPTVNGKNGNTITLDGSDLAVTGYTKAATEASILPTDTVNDALGKLEKKADAVPGKISSAISNMGEVLIYRGMVNTYADLPTNAALGDVYHVIDEEVKYAFVQEPGTSTTKWTDFGSKVDLSDYYTKSDADLETNRIVKSYVMKTTQALYDALPASKNYDCIKYIITDAASEALDAYTVGYKTKSVGTELDSLNSNLTDLEQKVESGLTYSTDEHIVGKWIDGRDVYEKTYSAKNIDIFNTNQIIDASFNSSNVELIGCEKVFIFSDGAQAVTSYNYGSGSSTIRVNANVTPNGIVIESLLVHIVGYNLTYKYVKK